MNAVIMKFSGAVNTKLCQPGLKEGNVRSPKHPSQQPYPFKTQDPTRVPFPGSKNDKPNNDDPLVPPTADHNSGSEPDNTPLGPNDTDDGGMSTLEKILSSSESDNNPQPKNQDVKVFRSQWQPHIRVGPFSPKPSNPFKERKGAFNSRRNRINKRRKTSRNPGASNGDGSGGDDTENDGDDEDDDGPDDDDPITSIMPARVPLSNSILQLPLVA